MNCPDCNALMGRARIWGMSMGYYCPECLRYGDDAHYEGMQTKEDKDKRSDLRKFIDGKNRKKRFI